MNDLGRQAGGVGTEKQVMDGTSLEALWLNLPHFTISAELGENRELKKITGFKDKFLAIIDDFNQSLIRLVIVSTDQDEIQFEWLSRDKPPFLKKADTLDDAKIMALAFFGQKAIQQRKELDLEFDYGKTLGEVYGKGNIRPWLVKKINDFMDSRRSGIILIKGEAGLGKTAMIYDLWKSGELNRIRAVHFMRQEVTTNKGESWADWRVTQRALALQLGLEYGGENPSGAPYLEMLRALPMIEVCETQKTIIAIDGLDEGFAVNASSSVEPVDVQKLIPPGLGGDVFFLVTSRPNGKHLEYLRVTQGKSVLEINPEDEPGHQDELRRYISDRCSSLNNYGATDLGYEAFQQRLFESCEGLFVVAEAFLGRRREPKKIADELDEWNTGNLEMPVGFDAWVSWQWLSRIGVAANNQKRLGLLWGMLSCAGDELGFSLLENIVCGNNLDGHPFTAEASRIPKGFIETLKRSDASELLDDLRPLQDFFKAPLSAESDCAFYHQRYREFALEHVVEAKEQVALHYLLGTACLRWIATNHKGKAYALNHVMRHLRLAEAWAEIETLCLDVTVFLVPALDKGQGLDKLVADGLLVLDAMKSVAGYDMNKCFLADLFRVFQQNRVVLLKGFPLPVLLRNKLASGWDGSTTQGQAIRNAVESLPFDWLEDKAEIPFQRALLSVFYGLNMDSANQEQNDRKRIRSLVWGQDGSRVYSASEDGSSRIWRIPGGQADGLIAMHEHDALSLLELYEGEVILSGGGDGKLIVRRYLREQVEERVWYSCCGRIEQLHLVSAGNACDGRVLLVCNNNGAYQVFGYDVGLFSTASNLWLEDSIDEPISGPLLSASSDSNVSVSVAADAGKMVVSYDDREDSAHFCATLYDIGPFPEDDFVCDVASWNGGLGGGLQVSISPNGRWFLAAGRGKPDKDIWLWDLQRLEDQGPWQLQAHSSGVRCVAFSPDSTLCATGSYDCSAQLFRLNDVEAPERRSLAKHGFVLTVMCFDHHSQLLATGSGDRKVRVFDASNGGLVAVYQGHSGWIKKLVFALNNDAAENTLLLSGDEYSELRLWQLETDKKPHYDGLGDKPSAAAFSPCGGQIVAGSFSGELMVWIRDASSWHYGYQDRVPTNMHGKVSEIVYSQSGKWLGVACSKLRSKASEQREEGDLKKVFFPLLMVDSGFESFTFPGHERGVSSLSFSKSEDCVVSGGDDGKVIVWSLSSKKEVSRKEFSDSVRNVSFIKDDTWVVGTVGTIFFAWDYRTDELKVDSDMEEKITTFVVSDCGQELIAGGEKGGLFAWGVADMQPTLKGRHDFKVAALLFAGTVKNNKVFVSGDEKGLVRIWCEQSKSSEWLLMGQDRHKGYIESILLDTDTGLVWTHSEDEIQLWKLDAGTGLKKMAGARFSGEQMRTISVLKGGNEQLLALEWDAYDRPVVHSLKRRNAS